jgi:hypothetical protein
LIKISKISFIHAELEYISLDLGISLKSMKDLNEVMVFNVGLIAQVGIGLKMVKE